MSFGSQKQSQSSTPVDMTPAAFGGLQGPFAQRLAGLLGIQATTTPAKPGTGIYAAPGATGSIMAGYNPTQLPGGRQGAQYSDGGQGRPTAGYGNYEGGNGGVSNIRRPTYNPSPFPYGTPGTPAKTTFGKVSKDPLSGIPGYKGPLYAPMTPNEERMLALLQQQTEGAAVGNTGSTASDYLNRAVGGEFLSNPFLDEMIRAAQRPTFEGLEQTLSRTLPGRFTEAGQFINPKGSSAFDIAAQLAARDAGNIAADQATELSFGAYESERGRQQQAALELPGVNKQEVDTSIANLQAQALPRLIQEMGIERGIEEFNNRMNNLLTTLGIAAGVTRPVIAQKGEGKSSGFNVGLK